MKNRSTGSSIIIRSAVALLLLSGTFAGTLSSVAAQVTGNEYESPQFDFTLAWDDPWEVSEGSVSSTEGTLDQISLISDGGFLQIIMIVPNDEPQAYLDVLLEGIQDDGANYEEIGSDSGPDYISTTVEFALDTSSGPLDVRKYVEVATLETLDGDEALFTGSLLATIDDFENQWESLQDSVERDGRDPVFFGVPEGIRGGSSTDDPTPTEESSGNWGIDGNTFIGPNYGYAVEWDAGIWEADDFSDDSGDVLVLNSEVSQIQIRSYDEEEATARSCVTAGADLAEANDGVTDFGRTSDYDLPEPGEDSYARLYAFDYESDDANPVAFLQYFECRPMGDEEGVFLVISLLTTERSYEDELVAYEDVVATIEFGQGGGTGLSTTGIGRQGGEEETPTNNTGKEPVLKSASYTGGAYGYQVLWDRDVWEAEALTPDDGYEGVKLTSEGSSAWIEAIEAYDGDPEACVIGTGESLADIDGVSDSGEERRPSLPETDPDASVALYSYTYEPQNGDPLDFVEYIECRELVAGSVVLRVTIITVFDGYEDLVPEWEDLVTGIKITESSSNGAEEDETPSANNTDEEFPGVNVREYASPQYGFTLGWDNSWSVVSATSEEGGTTLSLDNGISSVIVFGGAFPLDPAECVDTLARVAGRSTVFLISKSSTTTKAWRKLAAMKPSGGRFIR